MRWVGVFALSAAASCGGGGGGEPSGPATPPPVAVSSVSVEPGSATIVAGATVSFSATARDASGNALAGRSITWSSSNAAIATVDASGVVTGVAAGGPVTITATSEGKSGTAQVAVIPAVASVTLQPAAVTLLVGSTTALSASVRDAANNELNGRQVTWTSADPSRASVSSAGVVTGVAPGGPVTITATSDGKSGTAQVTVLEPVASVAIAPASASVIAGNSVALVATMLSASGGQLSGRQVTWSSSNAAVATVNASGVVTGVAAGGPVTITATSEGKSGVAQVTVLAPVTTVTLSGPGRVKVGDDYSYSVTARIADGSVVVRPVVFSVADPATAIMTATGTLTPLAAGTIAIVVTIDGVPWQGTATAYDWTGFGSGSTVGVYLYSDTQITNKFGTSEYPALAFGCSGGLFLAYVDTENFVTQNGLVAYSFDGGSPVTQTWIEFDLFSALGHPGPSQATRAFALAVASSRRFGFAFTEYNATARATLFRVTGLAPWIAPWLTACPSASSMVAESTGNPTALERLQSATGRITVQSAERALREQLRLAVSADTVASPAGSLRSLGAKSASSLVMRRR